MTASASIVRPATAADEGEIWRLFKLLHAENAMFPMSERKIAYHISRFLHPQNIAMDDPGPRGFIGVIGPVGALEGAIMMGLGSPWYSETITLDEYLNFVDPDCRQSNHAKALIAYAKHMVDEIRKVHAEVTLVIGILSTHRTAAKVRLYEKLLTPIGAFFAYPPPQDVAPPYLVYQHHNGRALSRRHFANTVERPS